MGVICTEVARGHAACCCWDHGVGNGRPQDLQRRRAAGRDERFAVPRGKADRVRAAGAPAWQGVVLQRPGSVAERPRRARRSSQNKLTAASATCAWRARHRHQPRNGKSVDVKVNDRGPYVRGRVDRLVEIGGAEDRARCARDRPGDGRGAPSVQETEELRGGDQAEGRGAGAATADTSVALVGEGLRYGVPRVAAAERSQRSTAKWITACRYSPRSKITFSAGRSSRASTAEFSSGHAAFRTSVNRRASAVSRSVSTFSAS